MKSLAFNVSKNKLAKITSLVTTGPNDIGLMTINLYVVISWFNYLLSSFNL